MSESINMKQVALEQFCNILQQLLDALTKQYPECTETSLKAAEFRLAVTDNLIDRLKNDAMVIAIRKYYKDINGGDRFVERISEEDWTVIDEAGVSIDLMVELDVINKFHCATVTDSTRTVIFRYLQALNQQATLYMTYSQIPEAMLDSLTSMALDMRQSAQSGQQVSPQAMMAKMMGLLKMSDLETVQQNMEETNIDPVQTLSTLLPILTQSMGTENNNAMSEQLGAMVQMMSNLSGNTEVSGGGGGGEMAMVSSLMAGLGGGGDIDIGSVMSLLGNK